jgi:DNA-directed RNA polymerase alpha subunit
MNDLKDLFATMSTDYDVKKFRDLRNKLIEVRKAVNAALFDLEEILDETKIEQLDLSVRAYKALKRAGINKITEVRNAIDDGSLLKKVGIGPITYKEILEKAGYKIAYNGDISFVEE